MIRAYEFAQGKSPCRAIELAAIANSLAAAGAFVWVDFEKSDANEATPILDGVFHFHPLSIEDCIATSPSSKVEEYAPQPEDKFSQYLFIVMHAVDYKAAVSGFALHELNLFLGKNFLVTYHDEPLRSISLIDERCKKGGPNHGRGPDRLAHAVLDELVENYRPALDGLAQEINSLEELAIECPEPAIVQRISRAKKEVARLRQTISPQNEVVTRLARGEFALIRASMLPYFRDIADELSHISAQAQTYADSLTAVLQVYLSTAANRTNDIVKVLTLFTVLTTPLMIVSTWYGMNFKNMPELDWRYGYALASLVVAVSTAGAFWYFKKRNWF